MIRWGRRAAERWGRLPAALLVAFAGLVSVAVVGLLLGLVARACQHSIDEPFYSWMAAHSGSGAVTRQMRKLSTLGDIPMTQVLGLIGSLVLAWVYRRRWWVPLVVVGFAYLAERELQTLLAHVIDRGHPAGQTGTFPSGGVGRPLAVYGAVLTCTVLLFPALSAARRRTAYLGLVGLAVLIGISRIWLGKHWLSDVISGLPFGLLLLATVTGLAAALTAPARDDAASG